MGKIKRFLLARHGQTNFNLEERIQGTLDSSTLTLDGISQVSGLGFFLATLLAAKCGRNYKIRNCWCSPMTRARQSFAAVAGCCEASGNTLPEPVIRRDLREIELQHWEGKLMVDIANSYPDDWSLWRSRPEEYRTKDGTAPLVDCWNRACGNWEAIRSSEEHNEDDGDGTTFIMAHGALGRCMLQAALGLTLASYRNQRYAFDNADCVEIEWDEGSPVASRWRRIYQNPTEWQTSAEAIAEAVERKELPASNGLDGYLKAGKP